MPHVPHRYIRLCIGPIRTYMLVQVYARISKSLRSACACMRLLSLDPQQRSRCLCGGDQVQPSSQMRLFVDVFRQRTITEMQMSRERQLIPSEFCIRRLLTTTCTCEVWRWIETSEHVACSYRAHCQREGRRKGGRKVGREGGMQEAREGHTSLCVFGPDYFPLKIGLYLPLTFALVHRSCPTDAHFRSHPGRQFHAILTQKRVSA